MKFLVVGIDGIDAGLVRDLPMPFLQSRIASSALPELTEDLWSRGWAEIVSGAHGHETGAFYCRPRTQGRHDFTQSYRKDDFAAAHAARPLWSLLADRGVTSGFMNIPTTYPAPIINGFFVSGAGSGLKGSGGATIPEEAVHPAALSQSLMDHGYVFDLRVAASGIEQTAVLMKRLGQMAARRSENFIALTHIARPEFGFVAYMAARSLCNLAMADICAMRTRAMHPVGAVQHAILDAFATLDTAIRNLVEKLQPEWCLFVSDHGTTRFEQRIDPNVALAEMGYQKRNAKRPSHAAQAKQLARAILPEALVRAAGRSAPASIRSSAASHGIDLTRAEAFSARYVPGIYINDARFGGPVADGRVRDLADEITQAFNAREDVRRAELSAAPYRPRFEGAQFDWLLPDIWIDHPDEIFFEHGIGEPMSSHGDFLALNPDFAPLGARLDGVRDLWTGVKARHPLFAGSAGLEALVVDDDPRDLRLAHRIIERVFA